MTHPLFDRSKSCLVVIDVQDHFLGKLPPDWRAPLVERIGWLMRAARALGIPIVATAEDIRRVGPLVSALSQLLPEGTGVHDKLVFGLAGQAPILEDIGRMGRSECVLAGLETDVCIAQSAMGLMAEGFRVAVIEDATASPPPHHEAGLRRITAAGGLITTTKGIYYEWVRDLATLAAVSRQIGPDLPPGLTL